MNQDRYLFDHRDLGASTKSQMKYRPEIDGLRCVAVAPVILLHAGFGFFPGGFLGVDVFFVISGFLITTILLDEIGKGSFSLLTFYERRARRILPALFLVMGVTSVFAYFWMLPEGLENYGQSLVATTLFSNNVLLAATAGYWDLESEFKPLLHTWSLGVEEQYYVLFPLLLLVANRYFPRGLVLFLWVLLFFSLGFSQWASTVFPNGNFYLLPSRAWELLIGAMCAIALNRGWPIQKNELTANLLSGLGLILIGLAMFAFDRQTPTPSLYALVPTAGAALVLLYAREKTIACRLLSLKPLVFAGLISYSAYLWHQPIISLARIYAAEEPTEKSAALLVAFTMVLAWLTWKYVEQPFRDRKRVGNKTLLSTLVPASIACISFGLYLHATHGGSLRFFGGDIAAAGDMYVSYNARVHEMSRSSFGEHRNPKLLVLGNSYARDFVNMARETFPNTKAETIYQDFHYLCLFKGVPTTMQTLIDEADVVVLASAEEDTTCLDQDIKTIEATGARVFVVGYKEFGSNLNWIARLSPSERSNRFNRLLAHTVEIDTRIKNRTPQRNFISLLEPIVKNGSIPITDAQGRLLSADRVHLTKFGAIYLGRSVLSQSALTPFLAGS